MTVVFFWNYLNHHQVHVADELHRLLGDGFRFVATMPANVRELKGGCDYSSRPYCIQAGESAVAHQEAMMYARTADVCVFGACSQQYAVMRRTGISFECGERWLKRGWLNILSPVLCMSLSNYRRYYRHRQFYKLCAGAYTAKDDLRLGCYKGRHYKWGYFTDAIKKNTAESKTRSKDGTVKMMWCARFIDWKHPELPVKLARKLKVDGYRFHIDMYGDGPLKSKIQNYICRHNLQEHVSLKGNVPNDRILDAMSDSDIFLFTSDRQEGWGAVANEALANRCCLVGADDIGAVPYLIRDMETGLVFKSGSLKSLYEKVKILLDTPVLIDTISEHGYKDLTEIWSPANAAKNFLSLVYDLHNGVETSIKEGPCSKA